MSKKITLQEFEKIKTLTEAGLTIKQTANILNRSNSVVRNVTMHETFEDYCRNRDEALAKWKAIRESKKYDRPETNDTVDEPEDSESMLGIDNSVVDEIRKLDSELRNLYFQRGQLELANAIAKFLARESEAMVVTKSELLSFMLIQINKESDYEPNSQDN